MKEKTKNSLNHCCTILLGLFVIVFIWTFAISIPIYARSFYYDQIDKLEIVEESGYDRATIVEAYDEVLDFLTLHKKFGTGKLGYTEEGKAHFVDCQRLFDLNLSLMVVSAAGIVVIIALVLAKKIQLKKYGKFNIWFYSGIVAVALPLVVLGIAAINFEAAFVAFHRILFPGKTNWVFDPSADEIIKILPEGFFASCAFLIGSIILAFCVALIVADVVRIVRKKKMS